MNEAFLEQILSKTRARVHAAKGFRDVSKVRAEAERRRGCAISGRFRQALCRKDRINIIAEIKRASPSKGVINSKIDVRSMASDYRSGGAAAISVLTESEYFGGSLDDLNQVAGAVDIPTLRKDFIVDEYQIYEAAAAGADAILLIVAALTEPDLLRLIVVTEAELGMDALVEVHTEEDMTIARNVGAKIIGINNRDLRSLEVSLDVSRTLITKRPKGAIMVAESGIRDRSDVHELLQLGFNAFLIGETLMRSDNTVDDLKSLVQLSGVTV